MELVQYSYEEFIQAYLAWANKPRDEAYYHPNYRLSEWNHYCDIRDSLPKGTTAARQFRRDAKNYH